MEAQRAKAEHLQKGERAEDLAAEYFAKRGYRILARNYKTRMGEVDLVLEKERAVVFVEVRYRKSTAFGEPVETVVRQKRIRILLAAMEYAQEFKRMDCDLRFDVLSVSRRAGKPHLEHFPNAFEAEIPQSAVPAFL